MNGVGKLPLLLVKAVEALHAQFKGCRHVQKVRCAGSQFGGCSSRQLACAVKDRIWKPTELENPVAQIFLEVGY